MQFRGEIHVGIICIKSSIQKSRDIDIAAMIIGVLEMADKVAVT